MGAAAYLGAANKRAPEASANFAEATRGLTLMEHYARCRF
jgi:hypothetical protein